MISQQVRISSLPDLNIETMMKERASAEQKRGEKPAYLGVS